MSRSPLPPLRIDPSSAVYVDGWVGGWAYSRGCWPPRPTDLGWHLATGRPHEAQRFVLTRGSLDQVLDLVGGIDQPTTCIKFAAEPETWLPLLPEGWVADHAGWFLTKRLAAAPPAPLARRYGMRRVPHDGYVDVEIYDVTGEKAAWGSVGLANDWAVPDAINTHENFRRQGLGRALMTELEAVAVEAGIERAVLGATTQGRALYRALGWSEQAPIMGTYFRPDDPTAG